MLPYTKDEDFENNEKLVFDVTCYVIKKGFKALNKFNLYGMAFSIRYNSS
jgi:hypothetical protein